MPHSPIGAGFGFFVDIRSREEPFVQRVAKFSHAMGATSQNSLNTTRLPNDGSLVVIDDASDGTLQLHSLFHRMYIRSA